MSKTIGSWGKWVNTWCKGKNEVPGAKEKMNFNHRRTSNVPKATIPAHTDDSKTHTVY